MNSYTYSEARQKLASLLDSAKKEGKAIITRKDGTIFEVKPVNNKKSPLDVEGVNVKLKKEEIIELLRESRKR